MTGKYALIIGNTQYTDAGLSQLTAPGRDAEDLAQILRDQNLCAFDEVRVLVNESSSTAIEAIDEFFDLRKPDDLLILYFSGHGVKDELGSLYLAFTNTMRTRLRSTAIKSDYVRDAMNQSRSKRQVLILDCCNSGAFARGMKTEVGGTMGVLSAFQGYGRYVLTASDEVQYAWEGDKIIGETENSLFTHFLLQGLRGEADTDSDGRITVDELYDYTYGQISRLTPNQTPRKDAAKQEGDIVLRTITRMQDIKPIDLPAPLIDSLENPITEIRLGAVQQLTKLLNGKNLGLARSARETLERIEKEDDSRIVSRTAAQALEPVRQAEQAAQQEAEEERVAREQAEAERQAAIQKAKEDQKAREESEQIALPKIEEERREREKREADQLAQHSGEENQPVHERPLADQTYSGRSDKNEGTVPDEMETTRLPVPATGATRTARSVHPIFISLGVLIPIVLIAAFAMLGLMLVNTTKRANANATLAARALSTHDVHETAMANSQATETAVMRSTNVAQVRSTGTAVANITLQARNNYVATLNANAQKVFGPEAGSLKHNADDSKVETTSAGVDLKNFIVQATFMNPYSTATSPWDYGFLFRYEDGDKQYRLTISSNGTWNVGNYKGTADPDWTQDGKVPNLDRKEGGSNTIALYCQGDKGILYVNGTYVADFPLAARMNAGDIYVATGLFKGTEQNGYSTDYKNFTIWKLP